MPWFKVDDNLAFHAKTVAAGNAALGLWVRAGSWSAQTLTEGFVPEHMVAAFGGTKNVASLLSCGLWDRVDGGYQFHDWGEYQPSRESVENDRKAAKERQQRARDKARQARDAAQSRRDGQHEEPERNGVSHGVTQPLVTVPPTRPDPTRPNNKPSGGAATAAPSQELALVEADPKAQNAAALIAEWIDHLPNGRPGGSVVGNVAKRVGALLADGVPYADVRRGLQTWQDRGLHPSTLDSVVHEVRTAGARPTRPRPGDIDLAAARARAAAREAASA